MTLAHRASTASRGMRTVCRIIPLAAMVAVARSPPHRSRVAAQSEPKTADDPAAFNPMMGALMNMFVQPRHAKLGLAGRDANWPLTAYELDGAAGVRWRRFRPRFRAGRACRCPTCSTPR